MLVQIELQNENMHDLLFNFVTKQNNISILLYVSLYFFCQTKI